MLIRNRFSYQAIQDVLSGLLEEDLHAKRIGSLCNATLGLLHSGRLAICAIGQGLAAARSLKPKHAVKQVDRVLSNPAIEVDDILVRWVPFLVGTRTSIVVAMDRTDFDADNLTTKRAEDISWASSPHEVTARLVALIRLGDRIEVATPHRT